DAAREVGLRSREVRGAGHHEPVLAVTARLVDERGGELVDHAAALQGEAVGNALERGARLVEGATAVGGVDPGAALLQDGLVDGAAELDESLVAATAVADEYRRRALRTEREHLDLERALGRHGGYLDDGDLAH